MYKIILTFEKSNIYSVKGKNIENNLHTISARLSIEIEYALLNFIIYYAYKFFI